VLLLLLLLLCLRLCSDGTQLAIAVSYTWEQGEREHPADAIYIRAVADDVIKPKGA